MLWSWRWPGRWGRENVKNSDNKVLLVNLHVYTILAEGREFFSAALWRHRVVECVDCVFCVQVLRSWYRINTKIYLKWTKRFLKVKFSRGCTYILTKLSHNAARRAMGRLRKFTTNLCLTSVRGVHISVDLSNAVTCGYSPCRVWSHIPKVNELEIASVHSLAWNVY